MNHYKFIAVLLCLLSLLAGCTSKSQQKAAIERTLDEYFTIVSDVWQLQKKTQTSDPDKLRQAMREFDDNVTKMINLETSNCPPEFKKIIHKNESGLKKLRGIIQEYPAIIDEALEIRKNQNAPDAQQKAEEFNKKIEDWMKRISETEDSHKGYEKELLEIARKYGVDTKPYEAGMSSSDFKKYEDEQASKKEKQKEMEERKEREAQRLAEIEERRYETSRLRVEEERLKTEQKRLEAEKLRIQNDAEQRKIESEQQMAVREREEKEARSRQEKADALERERALKQDEFERERAQKRDAMEAARLRAELDRINLERQSERRNEEAAKKSEEWQRRDREDAERNMNRNPREMMEEARRRAESQPQNQNQNRELPKPTAEEIKQFKEVFDKIFEAADELITVYNDDDSTLEQRKEAAKKVLEPIDDKTISTFPTAIANSVRMTVSPLKSYISGIDTGRRPEWALANMIMFFHRNLVTNNQNTYKQSGGLQKLGAEWGGNKI
jgi:hypothetical protein